MSRRLRWLNPPPFWTVNSALIVRPSEKTDFWQETHYGFRADNGHFLYTEVAGDFTISTKLRFHPAHPFDQAGLMVRAGPHYWIKTSVEHEPEGPGKLGAVVTNHGFSDWSVQDFPRSIREVSLRIRREGSDFTVEFARRPRTPWKMLRIAHLEVAPGAPLACGLYACSPKEAGFRAEFNFLRIEPRS